MNGREGNSGAIRAMALVVAAGLSMGLVACNGVSGVGDLQVTGDATTSGGGGASTGTGASTGASTGTGLATQCDYPTTGFGNKIGGVIPATKKWSGYAEHEDTVSTINIGDFYDCDGSRNINALLIDESAVWCAACQEEAAELEGKLTGPWADLGIHVLTLMVDDAVQGSGATDKTALAWKTKYKLDAAAVGVDSNLTFAPPGETTIGLPLQVLVDPRTMKIVEVVEGFSGDYSSLEALAKKNKPAK